MKEGAQHNLWIETQKNVSLSVYATDPSFDTDTAKVASDPGSVFRAIPLNNAPLDDHSHVFCLSRSSDVKSQMVNTSQTPFDTVRIHSPQRPGRNFTSETSILQVESIYMVRRGLRCPDNQREARPKA
ncbi:hypothetical protein C0992_004926 [Termitomyces sp. T32_za158]|nr:hypothetical protein C0992_004926 [Termitomyces sp. T32_za158]